MELKLTSAILLRDSLVDSIIIASGKNFHDPMILTKEMFEGIFMQLILLLS